MKNNKFFYYNIYLIKYYYYVYYYLYYQLNLNGENFINDYHFFKRVSFKINTELENNFNKTHKTVNFKLSNFFVTFLKNTLNSKENRYFFSNYNHNIRNFYFNSNSNFINFFLNFTLKKNNFLILDNDYSHIFPLYKFIHGKNTLDFYKTFFFLKPIFFTRKSWAYFFLKFCYKNNIKLLFVIDYVYFFKFYKNIVECDCSISAVVPISSFDGYIDYPLYTFNINNMIKLMYVSLITSIYFYSYNYNNYLKKYNYMNYFLKLINFSSVKN